METTHTKSTFIVKIFQFYILKITLTDCFFPLVKKAEILHEKTLE